MEETREVIEELKNKVIGGDIQTLDELCDACGDYEIQPFEDILSPLDWNSCDRCGQLGQSDGDFLWVEGFDWEDDNPSDKAIQKAIGEEESGDVWYSALCWKCVNELEKRGSK